MTSINIQTVSNKSNYTNFFSNPITFPKNTQISMPKANLAIPLFVSPQIPVPDIGSAPTNPWLQVACRVEIDGITHDITWQSIFNAHVDMPGAETFNDRDVWSANYKYMPCNQVLLYNETDAETQTKTSFNAVLARAITNSFDFYTVLPSPTFELSGVKNTYPTARITNPISGDILSALDYSSNVQTQLGFDVLYDPVKVFFKNETFVDVNNDTLQGWVQGAALHGLTGGGAAAGPGCWYGNQMDFDFNGGWFMAFPNVVTNNPLGLMAFGVQMVGKGTQANDKKQPFLAYDTKMIDFGVEWGRSNAPGGPVHFNIILPAEQYNDSTDTSILHSKFSPHQKVNGFDNNGDHFFIQILRGNDLQDTTGFILNILQGQNNNPHTDPNAIVIYTTNITLNPQTELVPVYICNDAASTDAWEINNIAFIPKTDDTVEQGDINLTGFFNATNTMAIEPVIENEMASLTEDLYKFWGAFGLFNNNLEAIGSNKNQKFFRFEGTDFVRSWKINTNFDSGFVDTRYFLGYQQFLETWEFNNPPGSASAFLQLNNGNSITRLPQMLNVALNNLDVKNFNGTLPYGISNDGTVVSNSQASDARVVGTIPIPLNDIGLRSQSLDLTYEPFNLLYRPINNPNAFTLNQLQVEIFFKDFFSNLKKDIQDINGTVNIEFHVRAGGNPAPPNKIGLRPI